MSFRLACIGTLALALASCNGTQSVLTPRGDQAEIIATLSWLLCAMVAVVFAIVMIATWTAISGNAAFRAALAREGAIVQMGIVLPIVTLTLLLGYSLWITGSEMAPRTSARQIAVTAEQWWWRVAYLDHDGATINSANEIRVPVGETVEFVLTSSDVIHSFWIPSLGGKMDMIPGRTTRLRLTATKPGIYRGQCAEYCGGVHALMALKVVALPSDEFNAWLSDAASPPESPASDLAARGREIFRSAGCSSCHAVRGVSNAKIGPDLTNFGSRRSVGIDTLEMSQENIARFIVEGQSIKPGNAMPEFRVFTPAQLDALSTYLSKLK